MFLRGLLIYHKSREEGHLEQYRTGDVFKEGFLDVDRSHWDCTKDTAQAERKVKGAPMDLGSLAVCGESVSLKLAPPGISNPRFTC